MKKKAISFILVCTMLFTFTMSPALAADDEKVEIFFKDALTKVVAVLMNTITGALNLALKEDDNFQNEKLFELTDFYSGNEVLLKEPAQNAKWSLGYSTTSLVPENYTDYYLGGFMTAQNGLSNKIKGLYDDMKVRTIAINDGSGRGTSVFATVDCIGMTNTDIRLIRATLAEFAKKNNICSINLFSTHCHSCIDTQGLWTNSIKTILFNLVSSVTGIGKVNKGIDGEYLAFLTERVKGSVEEAVNSMEEGILTFAQKSLDEDYFNNKNRPQATASMTDLTRFVFRPFNKSSTPTIIANLAAHPDVVGLATDEDDSNGQMLSGDYVYYVGETLNKAGYNFMFFNGAICGIYIGRGITGDGVPTERRVESSQRYGREIGRILLALSMTEEEIKSDPFLSVTGDTPEQMANPEYTLWYKNWQKVEETQVEPLLNIRLKSVRVEVTNRIIKLAGKLKLVNHTIIKDEYGKYFISTEIGYLQLGSHKIVMMPGEICQDLVVGGDSLKKENSINHRDFKGKTVREIFGEDTIVFGLANDAIGYVVPDNDYCMGLIFDHYQESLSLGKTTASFLMGEYEKLGKEVLK